MSRPSTTAVRSLWALSLCLGAGQGQQLRQVYPWGPETAWTRYNWPELKLRFPYENLQRADLDPAHVLHSSNGPHDADFYHRSAANQPDRAAGGVLHAYLTANEALVRCTTCNLLQATAWGQMRVALHEEGIVPSDKEVSSLLTDACTEQIPELMKTVGAMQQQVAEMLGQVGSAAALPTTLDGPNTSKLCKSLLEVPDHGATKSIADALLRGMRLYASSLNFRVRPKTRTGAFDDPPVAGVCEDYHSMCGLWTLREECDRNPGYMVGNSEGAIGHCKASCGTCLARLPSGELPTLVQFPEVDIEALQQVQFQGCNASGICNGVDLGLLPKITSVPLTPQNTDALEDVFRDQLDKLPSPTSGAQTGPESMQDLIKRAGELPDAQCFQRNAGWWTYELCPRKYVKQLHVDPEVGDVQQTIDMGFWDASKQPQQSPDQVLAPDEMLGADGSTGPVPYLRSLYTGGSQCDIDEEGTTVARETEVRMACSPDGRTYLSTTEPSKCSYLLVLLTPDLCANPKPGSRRWGKAAKALFKVEL